MRKHRTLWAALVACLVLVVAACNEMRRSRDADEDEEKAPVAVSQKEIIVSVKPLVDNFDSDTAGKLPAGFSFARTGQGAEGQWVVKEDPTAPSKPNVLAQISTDRTDYRFPLAILDQGSYQDAAVSVKFKAVAGRVDQAAGIVFRYQDPSNYYVARANAREDNYNLYRVISGRRRQITGLNFRVTPNQWHTLRVVIVGEQIRCSYDGELKIRATDETFPGAGKVGLWTKADSVTYFDDLEVSAP